MFSGKIFLVTGNCHLVICLTGLNGMLGMSEDIMKRLVFSFTLKCCDTPNKDQGYSC